MTVNIPKKTLAGLQEYGTNHRHPGDFLLAVLENNLAGALGTADPENLAALYDIVLYAWNHLPLQCHGSREAVREWLKNRSES